MTTRLLTLTDYESAFALWQRTPGMGLNSIGDSRDGFARFLARNPRTCFAAVENDLIGVILAGHDGRRGHIYHLAVDAAHRREGIGTALVRVALDALAGEGITKVALVAFVRNEEGNAFWEKQGFSLRQDLCYRNRAIKLSQRMDT